MKRGIIVTIFIIILLTSCSNKNYQSIDFDGRHFELVPENENSNKLKYTIKSGGISSGESYDLYIEDTSNGHKITYNNKDYFVKGTVDHYTVTFPNKDKATVSTNEGMTTVAGAMNMNIDQYPDVYEFIMFVNMGSRHRDNNFSQVLLGFVLIIIGVIGISNPEISWYLSRGWQYKNAEPSELYLSITKFFSVISCLLGIAIILTSCMA